MLTLIEKNLLKLVIVLRNSSMVVQVRNKETVSQTQGGIITINKILSV